MIRQLQKNDMDQVIQIWLEGSIQAHDFISEDFWESKVDDMRQIYLPAAETYVYEDEGGIKGFISLYENTVAAIFVSPSSQGQGIGNKLIEKAKELRKTLRLTVYKANDRSITFYERCSFRCLSEQIDDHTGFPELVMVFP